VLDLSRIDLATEEDKQYQLDYWAALFKAKTWEEQIRQQCLAREDYNRTMKGIENNLAAQKHKISTLKKDLADASEQLSKQN